MTYIKFIFLFFLSFSLSSCSSSENSSSQPTILVSIAPYHAMIKKIVGDHAQVHIVVSPGVDSHTFEPTSRQMLNFGSADIWFQMGENFETKMTPIMINNNPNIRIRDLREGIELLNSENHHCVGHKHNTDVHIWMSPKRMKQQIQLIFEHLSQLYPQHTDDFQKGFNLVMDDLISLDKDISQLLSPLRNRTILVSHNPYAYFANDYHLKVLAIECEGKEAGSRYITSLLRQTKKLHIQTIFAQEGLHKKGAERMAAELGISLHYLDPYSPYYFRNMRKIAKAFYKECSS